MRSSTLRSAILAFTASTACIVNCHSQSIQNIESFFKNGRATIQYDLVGLKAKEVYRIKLYSSHDNFSYPLKMVSGDVGDGITEGSKKVIEWDANQEIKNYREDVTFKVEAVLLFQPLAFINPTGRSIRRGQKTIVEWYGGKSSNEKELTLFKGESQIASFGKMNGVWVYRWKVDPRLKKGDDYTFRLNGEGEYLVSNRFTIKPKMPWLLKLSPVLIAAALVPFISGEKGAGEIGALPDPPNPD